MASASDSISVALVHRSLDSLLRELLYGPPGQQAYVLNPGDAGLLASLDALSSEDASASPDGRSSIAAHVDHLRHGFSLMNRWFRGENPFGESDYAASWQRQRVSEDEWRALRAKLADEVRAWLDATAAPREWDDITLTGALSSAVHLAYHVGAIRQVNPKAKGPVAKD